MTDSMTPATRRIAYFITPHGYGHAARAAAIMTALTDLDPSLRFEIFTKVPQAFFEASLGRPVGYHPLMTDIGVAQRTALHEDLPETVRRLDELLPFEPAVIDPLAAQVSRLGCELVLCDVAAMGIAVAQAAKLPSILIENFTWDWIYQGYVGPEPRMADHIPYLQSLYGAVDYHIQTEPICDPRPVDLTVKPVSRKSRTPVARIRGRLGVPEGAKVVMVTLGGGSWDHRAFVEQLEAQKDYYLIIAGNSETLERHDNWITLPHQSEFFHPDLVNASDAVIGKVGYSTLAEVYQAGIPFGYISRQQFRETPSLTAYIRATMSSLALTETQFADGGWLSLLPELLALPRYQSSPINGADQVAAFVYKLLT